MRHSAVKLLKMIALVGLVLASLLAGGTATASTQPSGAAPKVAAYWACWVPLAATYDRVITEFGVCNPTGYANSYHVVVPTDGLWVCRVPPGFTHDRVSLDNSLCSVIGYATTYHLRVPARGIWACTVPAGFGYDRVFFEFAVCNATRSTYSYHLV